MTSFPHPCRNGQKPAIVYLPFTSRSPSEAGAIKVMSSLRDLHSRHNARIA
jgi:hypothetical protein